MANEILNVEVDFLFSKSGVLVLSCHSRHPSTSQQPRTEPRRSPGHSGLRHQARVRAEILDEAFQVPTPVAS